jgi:hypothetical protein
VANLGVVSLHARDLIFDKAFGSASQDLPLVSYGRRVESDPGEFGDEVEAACKTDQRHNRVSTALIDDPREHKDEDNSETRRYGL